MIKKLRRKLMGMFLSITILIFTAAMLLMIGSTVNKVQSQEVDYGNNMADIILDLAQHPQATGSLIWLQPPGGPSSSLTDTLPCQLCTLTFPQVEVGQGEQEEEACG